MPANPVWTREEIYHVADRAYRLYREGRLRDARILFEGLIAIDPENTYCPKALAAICMGLQQYAGALRHLDTVLARDPFDPQALAGRCEALIAMRDLATARLALESLSALPAHVRDERRLRMLLEQAEKASGVRQLPAGAPR
jgi:predicted Zn-dependent protease